MTALTDPHKNTFSAVSDEIKTDEQFGTVRGLLTVGLWSRVKAPGQLEYD
jgi:hypothetical protein